MKTTKSGLTVSQFARKNEVSQPTISNAVKAGRLPVEPDGSLGKAAQAAWDRSRSTRAKHTADVAGLADIKLRREKVRLRREELELAEKEGRMLDTGQVDAELGERFLQF